MRFILAALIFFALPAFANNLSSRYEVIGQMDVIVDGEELILPIAVDLEAGRSFAEIQEFFGVRNLTISGVSVSEDGSWDRPIVSLMIGLGNGPFGGLSNVSLSEKGRDLQHPTEANIEYGKMEMTDFSITDQGEVELDFTAELIRFVLDEEYNQTPEEGLAPVAISGHVSVVIPAEFQALE